MPFFAGAFDAGQGRGRGTYGGDVRDGIHEGGAGKSVVTWLIYMCKVHLYLEVEIVVASSLALLALAWCLLLLRFEGSARAAVPLWVQPFRPTSSALGAGPLGAEAASHLQRFDLDL